MPEKDDKNKKEFIDMTIITTAARINIVGMFRRDLEKPNWHYYEKPSGKLVHFRKEHMVAVIENDDE